jgi:Copper amine oxidase N-terminal domain.
MKTVTKIIALLFIIGIVLSTAVIGAGTNKDINVNTDISVIIDGEEFIPKDAYGNVVEIFEYNGTTYVPVRAIAEVLSKSPVWIEYDEETRKVEIISATEFTPIPSMGLIPIVYVTLTDNKYHMSECSLVDVYEDSVLMLELPQAESFCTPCSVCIP